MLKFLQAVVNIREINNNCWTFRNFLIKLSEITKHFGEVQTSNVESDAIIAHSSYHPRQQLKDQIQFSYHIEKHEMNFFVFFWQLIR